jgi:hypothetical protein
MPEAPGLDHPVDRNPPEHLLRRPATLTGGTVGERKRRVFFRNLLVELLLYGSLVVAYSLLVMKWLRDPLTQLFHDNRVAFAFAGLGLIVAQGILLDLITSFLLDRLKLEREK